MQIRDDIRRKSVDLDPQPLPQVQEGPCPRTRIGVKLSRSENNEGGLLGKDIQEEEKWETSAGSNYAAKHRSELSADELEEIAAAYLVKGMT